MQMRDIAVLAATTLLHCNAAALLLVFYLVSFARASLVTIAIAFSLLVLLVAEVNAAQHHDCDCLLLLLLVAAAVAVVES